MEKCLPLAILNSCLKFQQNNKADGFLAAVGTACSGKPSAFVFVGFCVALCLELQGTAPSTSRYFSPVELLEHITIMYPKTILHHGGDNYFVIFPFGNRKNPTLKIQQLRRYISERNAKPLHCSCVFSQIVVNNKITKVVLLSQKFVKSGRINCIFAYCKNQK